MINQLTCSTTVFSMRIKSILLFHAIKFYDPTNLFLSMQKYILIDLDVNIKILSCEDTP